MTARSLSLEDSGIRSARRGRVYLVGAGPGDPELLTVRAHRLISQARVVAYDELVPQAILDIAPKDAERIAVGRRKGTCPDAPPIHPTILERAIEGLDVVRIKGGDPHVFGRGGEESEQLRLLHVPFEVVPGVSAALGAAAALGVPLTHRRAAASVTFATAHRAHDRTDPEAEGSLARRVPREGTVVLYMGLSTLSGAARELVEAGRSPSTPVCVVSHATLPTQRHVIGSLADIADAARDLPSPALVIVGEVVAKRMAPDAHDPDARDPGGGAAGETSVGLLGLVLEGANELAEA